MNVIQKQYVVNERHHKVAVQIDIDTFQKIEDVLENYALFQLMQENAGENGLDAQAARAYYQHLEKAP